MLNTIKKIALSTIGIVVLSAPALAKHGSTPGYLAEIDSCIVELARRIDVSGAERLRHVVTKSRRSGSRYALSIETTVFTADGETNYSVYCLASGNATPIAFKLKAQSK